MSKRNVLEWRRKPAEFATADPALLWTMTKERWQIGCMLQNCGRRGWSVQVRLNGLAFIRHHFRSWEDAIEGAEDRYAELVRSGWTPSGPSPDDDQPPA